MGYEEKAGEESCMGSTNFRKYTYTNKLLLQLKGRYYQRHVSYKSLNESVVNVLHAQVYTNGTCIRVFIIYLINIFHGDGAYT